MNNSTHTLAITVVHWCQLSPVRAHAQMLYDQPQLVRAHLDAFALTGGRRHAATARGILDYLLRDLAAPGGGFYSAEARA